MSRIRTIKPEFPQSESMGRISREARLCFIMLWTVADDAGRLRANSRMLASLLYPYDNDAIKRMDGWLDELAAEKCIRRYVVNGDHYADILNWLKYQKIDRPSPSKYPEFDDGSTHNREDSTNTREDSRGFDEGSCPEGNGREGSGEEGMQGEGSGPKRKPSAPTAIAFDAAEGWSGITDLDLSTWRDAYPAIDVSAQLKAAFAWARSNPKNRKANWSRFIANWLARAQERAARVPTPQRGEPSRRVAL